MESPYRRGHQGHVSLCPSSSGFGYLNERRVVFSPVRPNRAAWSVRRPEAGRLCSSLTFATTLGRKWKTLTGLRPIASALAENSAIIVGAAVLR